MAKKPRKKNQRRRRRAKKILLCIEILILLLLMSGFLIWKYMPPAFWDKGKNEAVQLPDTVEKISQTESQSETETVAPVSLSLSAAELVSSHALLIRLSTGQVVLDKNSEERFYPASMTKIMTAIVVLENIPDLQANVLLPTAMFDSLYEEGSSMAGFVPEEEVAAIDLLYGIMLPSGGECCIGLAEYIAGYESAFTELMNQKARELGMNNTHFCNSTGLHEEEHYTTAADLAILLTYALKNPVFEEIFTANTHSTAATGLHPEGITFQSTLFRYMPPEIQERGYIKGGKTGFTTEAGLCLASIGEVNGEKFILITGGAQGTHETEQFNITDADRVYGSIRGMP